LIYHHQGRLRWYRLGNHRDIGLAGARDLARKVMNQVADGKDPQADRKALRGLGTFEELASHYVEVYAKKKNKSWKQPDALVRKHLVPLWGKLKAPTITRDDVELAIAKIKAPIVANQTLAAASAIFNWAITKKVDGVKENPCHRVERNDTNERERTLLDFEVPKFWAEFDGIDLVRGAALKMILLTGQRSGEVSHMRYEHIVDDGWWEFPGEAVPALGWPGTKNRKSNRVWLSAPARDLIAQVNGGDEVKSGFVFLTSSGRPVSQSILSGTMQRIWSKLVAEGVERPTTEPVKPHDLRRTLASRLAELGFPDDAIDRVLNHKKQSKVRRTYNRYGYAKEDKEMMETVARHIMALVRGEKVPDNVVAFPREVG